MTQRLPLIYLPEVLAHHLRPAGRLHNSGGWLLGRREEGIIRVVGLVQVWYLGLEGDCHLTAYAAAGAAPGPADLAIVGHFSNLAADLQTEADASALTFGPRGEITLVRCGADLQVTGVDGRAVNAMWLRDPGEELQLFIASPRPAAAPVGRRARRPVLVALVGLVALALLTAVLLGFGARSAPAHPPTPVPAAGEPVAATAGEPASAAAPGPPPGERAAPPASATTPAAPAAAPDQAAPAGRADGPTPAEPAPRQTAGVAPAPQRYTIEPGDSLLALALRFYGDEAKAVLLIEANDLTDADHIEVGQVLLIPPLSD